MRREHQRHFAEVVRELIGVPAQQRVAAVHVDAAEEPVGQGVGHFVLEGVARQGGVVVLDVEAEVVVARAVALQECVDRGGVVVVLVLGRLARLGLDEQRPA